MNTAACQKMFARLFCKNVGGFCEFISKDNIT